MCLVLVGICVSRNPRTGNDQRRSCCQNPGCPRDNGSFSRSIGTWRACQPWGNPTPVELYSLCIHAALHCPDAVASAKFLASSFWKSVCLLGGSIGYPLFTGIQRRRPVRNTAYHPGGLCALYHPSLVTLYGFWRYPFAGFPAGNTNAEYHHTDYRCCPGLLDGNHRGGHALDTSVFAGQQL